MGARSESQAGGAEATLAARRLLKLGHLYHHRALDRLKDQLADLISAADLERLAAIGVQQHHLDLAAVVGVDEAGRVDDGDAALGGQAAARLDEARVSLRDRQRYPRSEERPLPGVEGDVLPACQIAAGVAGVCVLRGGYGAFELGELNDYGQRSSRLQAA